MMLSVRQAFAWLCAAAWLATGTSSAVAAIMYGDFSDVPPGVVMYTDVTESSPTDPDEPPVFFRPRINGNMLTFDPKDFGAVAEGGDADLFDGQLNLGIMAAQNSTGVSGGIGGLLIEESGDFSLFGTGTAVTSVAAGISARVDILAVDGVPLDDPLTVFANTQLSEDLESSPGLNQFWELGLLVDFAPALEEAEIDPEFGVTKARVVIGNTLSAVSESDPSTAAAIAKRFFKINPIEVDPNPSFVIPEPASALLLLGLLAGAWGYCRLG